MTCPPRRSRCAAAQQRRSASLLLWRHRSLARAAAGWRHAARGRRLALLRLRVGFAAARAALHAWREGAAAAAAAERDRLRNLGSGGRSDLTQAAQGRVAQGRVAMSDGVARPLPLTTLPESGLSFPSPERAGRLIDFLAKQERKSVGELGGSDVALPQAGSRRAELDSLPTRAQAPSRRRTLRHPSGG